MALQDRCGAKFTTTDSEGGPALALTCDRTRRTHLVHETSDGTPFIRTPRGAFLPRTTK